MTEQNTHLLERQAAVDSLFTQIMFQTPDKKPPRGPLLSQQYRTAQLHTQRGTNCSVCTTETLDALIKAGKSVWIKIPIDPPRRTPNAPDPPLTMVHKSGVLPQIAIDDELATVELATVELAGGKISPDKDYNLIRVEPSQKLKARIPGTPEPPPPEPPHFILAMTQDAYKAMIIKRLLRLFDPKEGTKLVEGEYNPQNLAAYREYLRDPESGIARFISRVVANAGLTGEEVRALEEKACKDYSNMEIAGALHRAAQQGPHTRALARQSGPDLAEGQAPGC